MWQVGKTYAFVPSGDAEELALRITAVVSLREAIAWYEKIYDRPFELDAAKAFRALIVHGGRDADIRHRRGDLYYVFDSDFGPSHSQPEGPRLIVSMYEPPEKKLARVWKTGR